MTDGLESKLIEAVRQRAFLWDVFDFCYRDRDLKKKTFTEIATDLGIKCTPGTGKSTLANQVAEELQWSYINVGEFARENNCLEAYDDTYQCHVLNEDQLLDELEDVVQNNSCVVEYHGCDFFPERWFSLVVVLRCTTEVLYDRLTARGYSSQKIEQNMQCEIFQSLLEEAHDSYREDIILDLPSNTSDDLASNVEKIVERAKNIAILNS